MHHCRRWKKKEGIVEGCGVLRRGKAVINALSSARISYGLAVLTSISLGCILSHQQRKVVNGVRREQDAEW